MSYPTFDLPEPVAQRAGQPVAVTIARVWTCFGSAAAVGLAAGVLAFGPGFAVGGLLLGSAALGAVTAWALGRRRPWAYWATTVAIVGQVVAESVVVARQPATVPIVVGALFAILALQLVRPSTYRAAVR